MGTSSTNEHVGARLKRARSSLGLSQKEMAAACGCELRAYQNYERGERAVSDVLIRALYRSHQVDPVWLLDGKGEMLRRGDRIAEPSMAGYYVWEEQMRELAAVLARLPGDTSSAILVDAIARAEQAAQLEDLRRAVDQLTGKSGPK